MPHNNEIVKNAVITIYELLFTNYYLLINIVNMRTNFIFPHPQSGFSSPEEVSVGWSKLITGACLYLLFAILLAYAGLFNTAFLLAGLALIIYFSGAFHSTVRLFRNFFLADFDFLRFLMVIVWVGWFLLLLVYSPFPAFSGRDEGSYANAAIYLAHFHSTQFQLPLENLFKEEGLSHQLLNFPGFVATPGGLTSQFSPAYFVLLGVFASLIKTVAVFPLINGLLILGGVIAFYLLLRLFAPRWFAFTGVVALLFNFAFLWFPRFTFSENLAFLLFLNLLYFLYLFYRTNNFRFVYPIIALLILFPLTRPEGWWLLAAGLAALGYWLLKGRVRLGQTYLLRSGLAMLLGMFISVFIAFQQFPVYKRLLRDWIKWPATQTSYANLLDGHFARGDIGRILAAPFPTLERSIYYLKVEWDYGILFFGLVALVTLTIFLFDRKRKMFDRELRVLVGLTAWLSFPFFGAFVSPQVSADHPWMLRRFFAVVLPCGILAALILIKTWMRKKPRRLPSFFAVLLLAILLLPSLPASAYFLTVKTDGGREAVLNQLGTYFDDESYIFLNRESSGDGWHMWAGPLSSVYGKNAIYVYSPENLANFRQQIKERFSQGKKNYVILQENTFDFEHELGKHFNLALDREIDFSNLELGIDSGSLDPSFPPVLDRPYKIKIYFLIPK